MEQQKTMKKWYTMVKNPQNEEDDQFAFAITKGKFKDVVYKYNRFGLIEPVSYTHLTLPTNREV